MRIGAIFNNNARLCAQPVRNLATDSIESVASVPDTTYENGQGPPRMQNNSPIPVFPRGTGYYMYERRGFVSLGLATRLQAGCLLV